MKGGILWAKCCNFNLWITRKQTDLQSPSSLLLLRFTNVTANFIGSLMLVKQNEERCEFCSFQFFARFYFFNI